MKVRAAILFVTALAGAGLLAGLAILSFGSPDQAARVPSSGMLVAGMATFAGAIYLQMTKRPAAAGGKLRSTLSTIGFAVLVVIAVFFLIGVLGTPQ